MSRMPQNEHGFRIAEHHALVDHRGVILLLIRAAARLLSVNMIAAIFHPIFYRIGARDAFQPPFQLLVQIADELADAAESAMEHGVAFHTQTCDELAKLMSFYWNQRNEIFRRALIALAASSSRFCPRLRGSGASDTMML